MAPPGLSRTGLCPALRPGGLPGPGQVVLGLGPRAVARLRRLAGLYTQAAYLRGDRPGFWWELPVAANLEWERRIRWGASPQGEAWVRYLAAVLGLGDRLHLYPAALRPGERAALDLALALIRQPGLLLWEEPLFGLDPREGRPIARAVRRLGRHLGFGIMAASAASLTGLRELATAWAPERTPTATGEAGA